MAELGCADSYTVAFTDNRGQQQQGPALEPSAVDWSRLLDDTSEATVTVPISGAECCGTVGSARSWCHDLAIWRNGRMGSGELVWQGPVVHLTHAARESTIVARDVSAWLNRLPVNSLLDFTATGSGAADLSDIAAAVIRDGFGFFDPGVLQYLLISPSGVTGERRYEPLTSYAGEHLAELGRTGIDWTVLGHRIIVGGEVPRARARLPQLGDDHFLGELTVVEDGLAAATRAIVIGEGVAADVGGIGECGPLTRIVKEEAIKDQASADYEAASIVAAGSPTPLIVSVPDGAQLAPEAPVRIADLVPGAVAPVTSQRTCYTVNTDLRLIRLSVSWRPGQGEAVKVTMAPVGVELQAA